MTTRPLFSILVCTACTVVFISAFGLTGPEETHKGSASAVSGADAVAEDVRGVLQALLSRGVTVDTDKARRAAIQAVAITIDPKARLVSMDAAATLPEEGNAATNGVKPESIAVIERWPGEICYAKFNGLYPGTGQVTVDAILGATNGGMCGMIFDLRGAGGKGLDCAESLAGLFVEANREIFSVKDWNGAELERHSARVSRRLGMPAVFLVDENTSTASELLAAVVKGGFEVLLVGRRTRGDPLIREKVELSGGDVLYIGTRRIALLKGHDYSNRGIQPDIAVEATCPVTPVTGTNAPSIAVVKTGGSKGGSVGTDELAAKAKGDPVLQRAVDILLGLRTLDTGSLRL